MLRQIENEVFFHCEISDVGIAELKKSAIK